MSVARLGHEPRPTAPYTEQGWERILEVGFYALILLMVVVLFNDIVKILPNSVYNFFFGS